MSIREHKLGGGSSMFCPTCGRDNSPERKFCASCGTNLEAVSRALTVSTEGLFTRVDASLDQFIARYAEHVFKDAPVRALDRQINRSWQVLGQGALTALFDLALFTVMTIVLPIKFLILLIYTPIKMLSERSKYHESSTVKPEGQRALDSFDPMPRKWLPDSGSSVTEHTTLNLADSGPPQQNSGLKTSPQK